MAKETKAARLPWDSAWEPASGVLPSHLFPSSTRYALISVLPPPNHSSRAFPHLKNRDNENKLPHTEIEKIITFFVYKGSVPLDKDQVHYEAIEQWK